MLNRIVLCSLTAFLLLSGLARADETDIRKAVASLLGADITVNAVRKLGALGLYEIQIGNDILYSDEKGSYLLQGEIYDVKAKRNLTDDRKSKLSQIKFSDLPLSLAVKTVRGNGKRVFATFEDPNCGYCKKLAKDMAGVTDVTIYTFLYPILSPDSAEKSEAIWCAPNRAKAWYDWMVNGAAAKPANCDNVIDKVMALGRKLNVRGTPTIFLANGERIPGAVPAAQLEAALNRVAK